MKAQSGPAAEAPGADFREVLRISATNGLERHQAKPTCEHVALTHVHFQRRPTSESVCLPAAAGGVRKAAVSILQVPDRPEAADQGLLDIGGSIVELVCKCRQQIDDVQILARSTTRARTE